MLCNLSDSHTSGHGHGGLDRLVVLVVGIAMFAFEIIWHTDMSLPLLMSDLKFVCLPVLYLFFGLRLLYIAWKSDPKGSQKKEMEEVRVLFLI